MLIGELSQAIGDNFLVENVKSCWLVSYPRLFVTIGYCSWEPMLHHVDWRSIRCYLWQLLSWECCIMLIDLRNLGYLWQLLSWECCIVLIGEVSQAICDNCLVENVVLSPNTLDVEWYAAAHLYQPRRNVQQLAQGAFSLEFIDYPVSPFISSVCFLSALVLCGSGSSFIRTSVRIRIYALVMKIWKRWFYQWNDGNRKNV